jgi:hypothetical protein
MKNGDISNELPKRIIVVSDVFLQTELKVTKRFKILPVVKTDTNVNRQTLSQLYIYTTRKGVTLELASFEMNEEYLGEFMDKLDNMGTNPFRYYSSYESVNHLVAELPYRPEVVGVLDIQSRQLRYGHWGIDQL